MIKRILYWVLIGILTLVIGGGIAVYIFKDRIIQRVIAEVNTYLKTPVQVEKVDIDFLHGFPRIAVRFDRVHMASGFGETLVEAEELYVLIDPISLARGGGDVDVIELSNAQVNIVIDKAGKPNYLVFQNPDTTTNQEDGPGFSLKAIRLNNVIFTLEDARSEVYMEIDLQQVQGKLSWNRGQLNNNISGKLGLTSYVQKSFALNSESILDVDLATAMNFEEQHLVIIPSKIHTAGTEINVGGDIFLKPKERAIDLNLEAKDATIALIARLMPERTAKRLKDYESSGDIYIKASIKGRLSNGQSPALVSEYTLDNVALTHPEFGADIKNLHLNGTLKISRLADLSTANVIISTATGNLMNKPFDFNAQLLNFLDPTLALNFEGALDAAWLAHKIGYNQAKSASGEIMVSVDYDGHVDGKVHSDEEIISGKIELRDVGVDLPSGTSLKHLDGEVTFSPGAIYATNFGGYWGKSDFLLNGDVTGIRAFSEIASSKTKLVIGAELKSEHIYLDEIVADILAVTKQNEEEQVKDIPELKFSLKFLIKELDFRRFRGSEIIGLLSFDKPTLTVEKFSSKTMGGEVALNGKLRNENNGDVFIEAHAETVHVEIDSLLYVFNNFNQNFLTNEFLKGQLTAESFASMYFTKDWQLRRNLLKAETRLKVVNGELNNFEPIMALSKFIDDRDDNLSHLKFSEIENYINVARDTIFIPEMTVMTNVRDIKVAGIHTLDQHIDYKLVVPVINENVDDDEAFGAVEKVQNASPNLHFRIHGTTKDYKVSYDLKRTVKKVINLLDLKKTFQQREQAEDSVALDDEEFDW